MTTVEEMQVSLRDLGWLLASNSHVVDVVHRISGECLEAYRAQASRVTEDFRREWETAHGAYRERQLFELVQNGADALTEAGMRGRIEIVLTDSALYCANEGAPIDPEGATALMHSHMSRKHAGQIGHFGLGFKSVLAISRRPRFFSRSGSFEFDEAWAGREIRKVVPAADRIPILRLARESDPATAASVDPDLARLMEWATTVVVLPYESDLREHLGKALKTFPPEFLLFGRSVSKIALVNETSADQRVISASVGSDGAIQLSDQESVKTWRVFEREVELSERAAEELPPRDIDEEERGRIPLAWAVPLDDARSDGRFWSFFPTNESSTMKGILNAGWKTTSDRHSLLDGPMNRELLQRFAELVADSLETTYDETDPAAHLDLLPPRDTKGWADDALSELVYRELNERPVVPDADRRYQLGRTLRLFPPGVGEPASALWMSASPRSDQWVHASVVRRDRSYRAGRLGARPGAVVRDWLEAMMFHPTVDNSRQALLVAEILNAEYRHRDEIRHARIVLTDTSELVALMPDRLFLSSSGGAHPGVAIIHPDLASDPEARRVFRELGVRDFDESLQLDFLAEQQDWERFWEMLHRSSDQLRGQKISRMASEGRLKVRTLAATFVSVRRVLIPGPIVPGPNEEDLDSSLDVEFHASDLMTLEAAGVVAMPKQGGVCSGESWIADYKARLDSGFREEVRKRLYESPQSGYVLIEESPASGPLEPLSSLRPVARARYTEQLIALVENDQPWKASHRTRRDHYGVYAFQPPPAVEMLRKHGYLATTCGPVPISEAVGPELKHWGEFLPTCKTEAYAIFLQLPVQLEVLPPSIWAKALERALVSQDMSRIANFYVAAARNGAAAPPLIRCRVGDALQNRRPSDVQITTDSHMLTSLSSRDEAFIPLDNAEDAIVLIERWSLRYAEDAASVMLGYVADDPAIVASDRLPELGVYGSTINLVLCSDIWVDIPSENGLRRESRDVVRQGDTLFCRSTLAEQRVLSEVRRLWDLPTELSPQEASPTQSPDLTEVNACETLEGKIALLFGADIIRRRLPADVVESIEEENGHLDSLGLAHVAHAIYGTSVLHAFRDEYWNLGITPPGKWSGSDRAVEFVESFGFPVVYAGSPRDEIPPWIEIDGPIRLHPLHEYQTRVAEHLRIFLRESEPGRGMLSLPTGAGKTRVVVEAFVNAYRDGDVEGVVLWIADREELCEQAVQTWKDVWRGLGPSSRLRISRLWGSTNNKIRHVTARPHLVVATYQSLRTRLTPHFDWLSKSACIVVDEAHGSIAPSYTRILEWMGLDHRHTERRLVGLSATPFRGGTADAEETNRLVKRYGQRRFDHDVFTESDPYIHLQEIGILAKVDQMLLPGASLTLSAAELEHIQTFGVMPSSAEEALGREGARNSAIISAIEGLPPSWPVLVFALSVNHAELLAAMLSLRGIPAVSVTSRRTSPDARRQAIQAFKDGRLRVLTNWGVLTTGFDAPGIRALFVTRPVFSPGLYQQMIGRGLRGPLNGGKDRCLIVNVADNLSQYGDRLAFRHFEYLWNH